MRSDYTPAEIEAFVLDFRKYRHVKETIGLAKNTEFLKALANIALRTTYPFPEYSTWYLSKVAEAKSYPLHTIQKELLDLYLNHENPGLQRNVLKSLTFCPLIAYKQGEFLDKLFKDLAAAEVKVAVKVHALENLQKFIPNYPELLGEIKQIMEMQQDNFTPAIRARYKAFCKKNKM
ncbi:hypothetical protein SAMN05216474_0311 [Lishizhenia tianjinensis]|uniref:HEAT repeat-containing protein n=1 Tax=Lishizhenia tianjinensis TaxID=477690 RepID=A0A1I6XMM3_9FLAO|nr:hypothetical protein [Lishizhenia tianjinensis]SFT39406.1 hypothetical protein SAMN05216474_0311 [Lishizhenia tianjinensis]